MYRVRLSSGEEAAFRSVEELALGIQSGVITNQAEIYHNNIQQWLPITAHPEFTAASEQASARVALSVAEAGPTLPDEDVEILLQGKVPIYKMHSLSARELEARRRPRWVGPATTGGAALIFVGAIVLASYLGGTGGDVAWSRQPTPALTDRSPSTRRQSAANAPGLARNDNSRPDALARRATAARAEAARVLGQAASAIGLNGLVSPQRLASRDSLKAARLALARFGPAVDRWRDDEQDVLSAYRDTAAALSRSGRWNPAEFTEWRVRGPDPEPLAMARAADSLLLLIDRGYALMDEFGELDSAGAPRFAKPRAGEEYDRIRTAVGRLSSQSLTPGGHVPPPLVILRSALSGGTFPARAGK